MGKSEALSNEVLDKVLGQTDFTPPVQMWLALYTTAPNAQGGGVEVPAVNGYVRVAIPNDATNWPTAVGGVKSNAQTIVFPTATGPWGTIVAFGLHTDILLDSLYLWGVLETPVAIVGTDDPTFTPLDLTVTET